MASSSTTPNLPLPPPPPSTEHQRAAVVSLDELVKKCQIGLRCPHESTRESTISALFRRLVSSSYDSLESFENAWHLGNYVIVDRKSGQKSFEPMSIYVRLGMHLLFYGPGHETVLHLKQAQDVLAYHTKQIGAAYDAPSSKAHIGGFVAAFQLTDSLKDLVEPDLSKYADFNEFFAREIKPSARPVAEPDNQQVVSSPADCRLMVFPITDQVTKYWIKGYGFTIAKLLHDDVLARDLDGGPIAIARLAPQDYHRWHSPVDGTIRSITEIPGTYYTVNPQAVTQPGTLNVFCENRRSVMVVTLKQRSIPVVIVAVGAMLVGSIKYNPGIAAGAEIKRGQCLGAFQYGGSTVILLFPLGEMLMDTDLVANSMKQQCETLVQVGWRIGIGPYQ